MSSRESEDNSAKSLREILTPKETGSSDQCSDELPSMTKWSSLILEVPEENPKRILMAEGLYSPGSGEICGKYIAMSDSDVPLHPYYNYPAILDPGILDAIRNPRMPVVYKDDGQDLYLAVCADMDIAPVKLFHRGLVTDAIDLSYYGVNPLGIRAMALALQNNKTVLRLDLTDNFLNNDACYHIAQMLKTNKCLQELILSGCRIGASGILRLGSVLSVNRTLVTLDLSKNCLGEDGGVCFAKQIADGARVARVSLRRNDLGKATAYTLKEALEYQNTLTHLDLSWNNFFDVPSAVKMLEQLSQSEFLQELNLSWNALEGVRVAGAIKNLFMIPSITVLNLSNNRLQGESLSIALGKLVKAKQLVTLDLSFNPMSTEDAYSTLEIMLNDGVKLVNLYLDGIAVETKFLSLLETVMEMKSRRNFSIKYGGVMHNWTILGPDARRLIMDRMDYLGKNRRMDVAVFFLRVGKMFKEPIPLKTLVDEKNRAKLPLDDDLMTELGNIFPGPKSAKAKLVDVQMICDYIRRIWPDRKLPPTPPPQPEPQSPLLPPKEDAK